jgi:hypothetical protein
MTFAMFWWYVTLACLAWFSTVTVYVAIRGAFDIKHMLARLRELHNDRPDSDG